MIVDDSVSMRQMVGFTLREGGFEVIEAEHGQDALDKLQNAAVDLVITDLNMPVMDGITLIQNLRLQPAMKSKPILMLTTEGLAGKKEQGKAAGPRAGWSSRSIRKSCSRPWPRFCREAFSRMVSRAQRALFKRAPPLTDPQNVTVFVTTRAS